MAPYLTVVIPVEIYNFIETMDNVESANAAGDPYNVREAQFADGVCTMISSLFGGVVPNTVWLGHPGLKKTNAGAGYSWISGVVLGLAGIFGLFTVLADLVPPAVAAITFLWCAVIMVAQAFKECTPKHYAAIAIAMVPSIADYLFTQVEAALATGSMMEGGWGIWSETLESGLKGFTADVTELLKQTKLGDDYRGADFSAPTFVVGNDSVMKNNTETHPVIFKADDLLLFNGAFTAADVETLGAYYQR